MSFYFEKKKEQRFEDSQKIKIILEKSKNIYFIGIGGIGLSALAQLFKKKGIKISGSDLYENEMTIQLQKEGIIVYNGHSKENIEKTINNYGTIDAVVYSPAVNPENIELEYFIKNNIPIFSYGQALSYFINSNNSITICGTHGKSSTTAILSEVMFRKGINISFLCGAILKMFGTNSLYNEKAKYFIAEACEYKETFLSFFPKHVIIPSLEVDHLDYYLTDENYFLSFKTYISHIQDGYLIMRIEKEMEKRLFNYSKDLSNIKKTITYSNLENSDFIDFENHIHYIYYYSKKNPFHLKFQKSIFNNKKRNLLNEYELELPIPSEEYAANFLSVFAFLDSIGVFDQNDLILAKEYNGIKRRFELLGIDKSNNYIISDYAHHPSEIRTLLKISKLKFPDKKIYLIFQAHQHSRTRLFLDDFLSLFKEVENLIILPIYRQRDSEEDCKIMSSINFFEKIKQINKSANFFVDNFKLYEFLSKISDAVFLFTGAGTIDNFAREYVNFKN